MVFSFFRRYIWGFQGILGAIQFLGLLFLPESPRWFIKKSRKEEARDILMRIRNGVNVDEEILEIEENFQELQCSHEISGNNNNNNDDGEDDIAVANITTIFK